MHLFWLPIREVAFSSAFRYSKTLEREEKPYAKTPIEVFVATAHFQTKFQPKWDSDGGDIFRRNNRGRFEKLKREGRE